MSNNYINTITKINTISQNSNILFVFPDDTVYNLSHIYTYYLLKYLKKIPLNSQLYLNNKINLKSPDFLPMADKDFLTIDDINYYQIKLPERINISSDTLFFDETTRTIKFHLDYPIISDEIHNITLTKPQVFDTIVFLGGYALDNFSSVYKNFNQTWSSLNIFHITNEIVVDPFTINTFSNTNYSSVLHLLLTESYHHELLSLGSANYGFAGLLIETNNLKTSLVNSGHFELIADLMDIGINHREIINHFYKSLPFTSLKLLGYVFKNIVQKSQTEYISFINNNDISDLVFAAESNQLKTFDLNEAIFNVFNEIEQQLLNIGSFAIFAFHMDKPKVYLMHISGHVVPEYLANLNFNETASIKNYVILEADLDINTSNNLESSFHNA